MNAVARALLGTCVNRFSMFLNGGELTWNAPNTIEINRGKEQYFLVRRKIRDDRSEPFYSTKRTGEGTGLGLSTVYGIVKQTGGYVFVQSAEGQGTEFNLILPIFDAQRTEIAPVIEEPKIQPRTYGDGVILLVEDEAPVRTFASRALQLRGYQVI
jgi:hypothetical protein